VEPPIRPSIGQISIECILAEWLVLEYACKVEWYNKTSRVGQAGLYKTSCDAKTFFRWPSPPLSG
jgi:hypothetical protein